MAYYDAFIAKWNTLAPGTTEQKLAAINAEMVTGAAKPAIVTPTQIINAIVYADLAALTQVQLLQLQLLLIGTDVNISPGTTVRSGLQSMFAGKAQTISQLTALVTPSDLPPVPWWKANGYPGPFNMNDCAAAGVS